jgi:hypothetical protein
VPRDARVAVGARLAVDLDDQGGHVATRKGAFRLVVYGLDTYSSYGYPAGGNAAVLSGVVVQPPQ